ncbi:FAD-dependent oxidoreductase [Streptomyces europaeiscabiei]|uniref:NAD(P)/FAD-dependent oxidoreductase n=1 Tax=Streptomyces europaeiscabiei TaxID=146819 RepID=UPI002E198675
MVVTVCGGGLTGIEAATEIAESHPGLSVTLISLDEPGGMMGPKARAYPYGALDRLGVTLETGARVTKVLPDAVEPADGRLVRSDACLWTTGVKVSPLAADAGIATDDRGLILVDATLRSVSHPEIHAIGDAAAVRLTWGQIHGTCRSGLPTAQYTADTIARLVRGKAVRPFRFGYFHQPVSLGRRDAVIQFQGRRNPPPHAPQRPERRRVQGDGQRQPAHDLPIQQAHERHHHHLQGRPPNRSTGNALKGALERVDEIAALRPGR